jgi:hypothetical protein
VRKLAVHFMPTAKIIGDAGGGYSE